MQWFGKPFGAPYEADLPRVAVPVGIPCERCKEAIEIGDSGLVVPHIDATGARDMPYHYACHFRAVVGGFNHLRGLCKCCGGDLDPDPPGMTIRQAAEVATFEYQRKRDQGLSLNLMSRRHPREE